jgi:hypothetical protein
MAQEKTLFRGAANATGTTLDTGANSLVNKLNLDWKFPRSITAITVTVNSSPDGSSFTPVGVFTNVMELAATLELAATHRFYNCVVTNYAGSGTAVVLAEPGETKENA